MKRINFLYLALIALMACSKSDPAPVAGCTVKFKGVDYSLPFTGCYAAGTTGQGLSASSSEQGILGQVMTLINAGSDSTEVDYIQFTIDNSKPGVYFSTIDSLGHPVDAIVTVSGKSWTFSGTMAYDLTPADTTAISGKCTCGN